MTAAAAPAPSAFAIFVANVQPPRWISATWPEISLLFVIASQASEVVPLPPLVSLSSASTRLPLTGPSSSSDGVKFASFIAYSPLTDGGAVTSIASNEALPSRVDAAAVITQGPPAGEPIVARLGPSLPAATTVKMPALVAASSARSSGVVTRVSELPTE